MGVMVVNVTDVEFLTNRTFLPSEASACCAILGDVQVELEAYLERTIETATRTETIIVPDLDWGAPMFVPVKYSPIQAVSSIMVDGTALSPNGDYLVDRSGVVLYAKGGTSLTSAAYNRSVTITYTAGLGEPAASQLAGVIARRTMRLLNKRQDDAIGSAQANVEGYNVSYLGEGWTDDEVKIIKRWRRSVGVFMVPADPYAASDSWSGWGGWR